MMLDYPQTVVYMESSRYPEPISMMEMVEIIKAVSKKRGIKLKVIAEIIGIHKSYFSKWANGADLRDMTFSEVIQVARILHLPVGLLVFGEKYQDLWLGKIETFESINP